MRCEARGQITMFFLIGLVLLFTAAILYAFMRDTVEAPRADPTPDVLNSYISTCVDSVVEEQLGIMGRTGGLWPAAQGYEFGTVGSQQVLYGITANAFQEGEEGMLPYAYSAPQYPDWGVRLANTAIIRDPDGALIPMLNFQDGYFGDVNLPALCRTGCRHYLGAPGSSGIKIGSGPELPADEALEQEITREIDQCINPGRFESGFIGADVQIVRQPAVDVQFTQQTVLVSINYSLTVDGTLQEVTFDPRYSVRYLAIAQFAHDLAQEETKDVSFAIGNGTQYRMLGSYRDGFVVSVHPSAVPDGDMITISDERSRIGNAQYEFRFLVKHRPPMLDWIDRPSPSQYTLSSCPAKDPDGHDLTRCDYNGDRFVVETQDGRDCLRFADDGRPLGDDLGDDGDYSC